MAIRIYGAFVYLLFVVQMKLSKERDSLAMTAKKLSRDLAKVIISAQNQSLPFLLYSF